MTFELDIVNFKDRIVELNHKYKELETRLSDMEANPTHSSSRYVSQDDFDEAVSNSETKYVHSDSLNNLMEAEIRRMARRTFHELNGTAIETLANVACEEKLREFAEGQISKSGLAEWLEENISGYVDSELDNLMCEKTQRTIEEYSLVNHNDLPDLVREEIQGTGYITEDYVDEKAYELKNEIEELISESATDSDTITELADEAIGRWIENADLYADITAHVKSAMIVSQVVNDVQCLNRVKADLERSGVINASGEVKDE